MRERTKTIQFTELPKSVRILRRVLEIREDLLSLRLQWKTINQRRSEEEEEEEVKSAKKKDKEENKEEEVEEKEIHTRRKSRKESYNVCCGKWYFLLFHFSFSSRYYRLPAISVYWLLPHLFHNRNCRRLQLSTNIGFSGIGTLFVLSEKQRSSA